MSKKTLLFTFFLICTASVHILHGSAEKEDVEILDLPATVAQSLIGHLTTPPFSIESMEEERQELILFHSFDTRMSRHVSHETTFQERKMRVFPNKDLPDEFEFMIAGSINKLFLQRLLVAAAQRIKYDTSKVSKKIDRVSMDQVDLSFRRTDDAS